MINMIAAVGKNGELGKKGGLCFKLKNEMKYFTKTTSGHIVIMGVNTYKSLPKLLKDRIHFIEARVPEGETEISPAVREKVLALNPNYEKEGFWNGLNRFEVFVLPSNDLEDFIKSKSKCSNEIFIIGGGKMYSKYIDLCDRIFLTEIDAEDKEADVFFPKFDKELFDRTEVGEGEEEGISYKFAIYQRK